MRLKESRARSFQAPVTIHNHAGSQVYVFQSGPLELDESSEEEAPVTTELRARGREQPRSSAARGALGDVVLLQREVTHGDSLNRLALQYGCKVADIKRVNNFIREQDLYALKSIKIPVKNHGLLTEKGQELQPLVPMCPGAAPTLVDIPEAGAESTELQDYFRGIDRSIEEAAQAEARLDAEFGLEAPRRPPASGTPGRGSGADCGIQWWNAVFVMLLIGVVLPVFYITYFKTQGTGAMAHNSSTTLTSNISADGLERKVPQNLVTEEIPKGGIKPSRASPASTEVHKTATLTVVRPGG